MSKLQDIDRLTTILESFSDITLTVLADFLSGEGGGVSVSIGLVKLGVTVFPVGVAGEDENGQEIFQGLHEYRISTSGISKLKAYRTPSSEGSELIHGEHPALLNLVEHARKFASASDGIYICDAGIGAASPRVLNFIKSNGCMQEKTLAEFEQLTAAVASEAEIEQAIGAEIDDDAEKLAVAGEGIVEEMKLESFLAVSADKLLAFSGSHKSSVPLTVSLNAADIDLLGAIFAAAVSAGAEPIDAAQVAAQVTLFMKSRGVAGKRVFREELMIYLAGSKATSRVH